GPFADEERTVPVLEGAGDDLGGAGAAPVDQENQRDLRRGAARAGAEGAPAAVAVLLEQDVAAIEELAGDVDRGADEAAGIAPQVQDQADRTLVEYAGEGVAQRGRRTGIETGQLNIRYAVGEAS